MQRSGNHDALIFFPGAKPTPECLADLQALTIVPRAAFTTVGPEKENMFAMETPQFITVHHTGFPKPWLQDNFDATAQHLEEIRQLHCDDAGRKWADIGYHFAVDRMGRVWQLRDLRFQGAHVKNHNANNAGIVVLGNFDLQEPTAVQAAALLTLVDFMTHAYGLANIYTHRQLADTPTNCPGRHLQHLMDQHTISFGKRSL
jgi:N-acetyl-anhydromuramyl-L-alanine amidase AmpD